MKRKSYLPFALIWVGIALALLIAGQLLRRPEDAPLAAQAGRIEGAAQATATAIAVEMRAFVEQVDAVNGYRTATFWSTFTPGLIFVSALIVVFLVIRVVNVRIEVYRARNMPMALPPPARAIIDNSSGEPITVNTASGSFEMERREDAYALVSRLLRAAMEKAGPESKRVPGWRELPGWTSDRWVEAVKLLGGAVTATPGKGTFCAGEYSLRDLWVSAARRDIPLPYRNDGQ